jgi:hypothetical protein
MTCAATWRIRSRSTVLPIPIKKWAGTPTRKYARCEYMDRGRANQPGISLRKTLTNLPPESVRQTGSYLQGLLLRQLFLATTDTR